MSAQPDDIVPVIGLEVHVQLATDRKLFSTAQRRHAPQTPNRYIDAISLGVPGALPVIDRQAVEHAVRVAFALECHVHRRSEWDRKHYFYPDLPKGYQITQQRRPLAVDGRLEILGDDGRPRPIRIQRVHIEEDAGKSVHAGNGQTRVDFNRAGAPLIEVVSAPDLSSPTEARRFLKRLHLLVRTIGASTAHMEQGELRCDANVSLGPLGHGPRVEIKNLNSFRYVEQALTFEIERQQAAAWVGTPIERETRLWDPNKRCTRVTRSKESAAGYRFLPEPDLPPLALAELWVQRVRASLPELPDAKSRRYRAVGLPAASADTLAESPDLAKLFDAGFRSDPTRAAALSSLLLGPVARLRKTESDGAIRVDPESLLTLIRLKEQGRLSSTQQKAVVESLWTEGGPVERHLPEPHTDGAQLGEVVEEILDAQRAVVDKYRAGKHGVLGFLVGAVMKATHGRADPVQVRNAIEQRLTAEDPP